MELVIKKENLVVSLRHQPHAILAIYQFNLLRHHFRSNRIVIISKYLDSVNVKIL